MMIWMGIVLVKMGSDPFFNKNLIWQWKLTEIYKGIILWVTLLNFIEYLVGHYVLVAVVGLPSSLMWLDIIG